MLRSLKVILICAIFCSVAYAEKAIQTTPCELDADSPAYDRKLVTLRAPVVIGFENSSFDAACESDIYASTWVTFAGDIEMPVIYCCGDHSRTPGSKLEIDGIELNLQKDSEFWKFKKYLTAEREKAPTGVPCFWDCFQYRVTATLTGHFFALKKTEYIEGYGHFGFSNLFVIEKVTNVEFQPTNIPIGDDFKCNHQNWKVPIDRSATIAHQKSVQSELLPEPDIGKVGEELVKERMKNISEDFEAGDSRSDYEGKFEKEKKAWYVWLSKDKLKSYKVSFERFDWLSEIEKKIDDRIWTPTLIERSDCVPKNHTSAPNALKHLQLNSSF